MLDYEIPLPFFLFDYYPLGVLMVTMVGTTTEYVCPREKLRDVPFLKERFVFDCAF